MQEGLILCIFLGLFFTMFLGIVQPSLAMVTIEVLSPRGEIEPPEAVGISTRLESLEGQNHWALRLR